MSMRLPEEVTRDYEVERELGFGGQGHSFLARRREDDEVVVLKTLDFVELSSWKDLELLQREMVVLRSLHHHAIPRLFGYYPEDLGGEAPEAFVVVQEYIEGETLEELLRAEEGPLFDEPQAREFLDEMLGILEYLHGLNPPVVHRDIKPSNIIRRPNGEHVLIDFGAARATGVNTGSTTFVGTNGYMPPEQLMGRAEPCSDLFALGATALELMTWISPSNLAREDLSFNLDVLECSGDLVSMLRVLTHPSPSRRYLSAARARRALADPLDALVLGVETTGGLEVERRADGVVIVRISHNSSSRLWTIIAVTVAATIAMGFAHLVSAPAILVFGMVILRGAIGPTAVELDRSELRLVRAWGPIRRVARWDLDSIAEIWSGPVPTMTGVLIQQRDGTQKSIQTKRLTPAQHHALADFIRNHKEGT